MKRSEARERAEKIASELEGLMARHGSSQWVVLTQFEFEPEADGTSVCAVECIHGDVGTIAAMMTRSARSFAAQVGQARAAAKDEPEAPCKD